jgi:hypothetical protein
MQQWQDISAMLIDAIPLLLYAIAKGFKIINARLVLLI